MIAEKNIPKYVRFMVVVKDKKAIEIIPIPTGTSTNTRISILNDYATIKNKEVSNYDFYYLDSSEQELIANRDDLKIGCEPGHKHRCLIDITKMEIIERSAI